jgi:hypothetical protein
VGTSIVGSFVGNCVGLVVGLQDGHLKVVGSA